MPSSRSTRQRLGAGVVELAGLADDDRAGADDQDAGDVGAAGHQARPSWSVAAVGVGGGGGPVVQPFHQLDEPVEQVAGVVRAGRRLRVVLHGEGRQVQALQALDDVVVQADVRDAHPPVRRAERAVAGRRHLAVERGVDGEAVVVRGDLDLAGACGPSPAG